MVLTEILRVSTETKNKLDDSKLVPTETYDNVIKRLLEAKNAKAWIYWSGHTAKPRVCQKSPGKNQERGKDYSKASGTGQGIKGKTKGEIRMQKLKDIIGKKIIKAKRRGIPGYDDKPYIDLTFDDGSKVTFISRYLGYTGKSEDEYPRVIQIIFPQKRVK